MKLFFPIFLMRKYGENTVKHFFQNHTISIIPVFQYAVAAFLTTMSCSATGELLAFAASCSETSILIRY